MITISNVEVSTGVVLVEAPFVAAGGLGPTYGRAHPPRAQGGVQVLGSGPRSSS